MQKTYRFLGRKGRTTIPFEIRRTMGFEANDLLSFERRGDLLSVKKEKICDNCRENLRPAVSPSEEKEPPKENLSYEDILRLMLRRKGASAQKTGVRK